MIAHKATFQGSLSSNMLHGHYERTWLVTLYSLEEIKKYLAQMGDN